MDALVLDVGIGALTTALVVLAAIAVRRHWWVTTVRSWSMYPTLRPGDLLPTRAVRGTRQVGRGDIVIVDSAELGRRVVKRVIGLPGETVGVGPEGVTIDGAPLPEPYLVAHGGPAARFQVPEGAYVVLGDHRRGSSDSRTWRRPYVAATAIRGRVTGPR